RLSSWLGSGALQHLGRISYSVYLVHIPIGTRIVNLGHRITGDSGPAAIGWILLALAATLVAAYILHVLVEAPCIRLASRLKPAGIATGRYDRSLCCSGDAQAPARLPVS
ncbi:MAG TPA: hypothetical protein VIK18_22155, partial [Pirellulales bacterium]